MHSSSVSPFLASFSEGLTIRPRRNRWTGGIRNLVRENVLTVNDLVMPLFIIPGMQSERQEIPTMPGIYRLSIPAMLEECAELAELGINAIALFPALPDSIKNSDATESYNPDGLNQQAVRAIKADPRIKHLVVITDVALDPYNSDGHDGIVDSQTGEIKNDETLEILGKMAVTQAKAGADIVAPSDMMDGRIGYIRRCLDQAGFHHVGILSYAAKYASSFYGPFRDALNSAPKSGDKKTYQMDPANSKEAKREILLDMLEGTDMVMVKPGLPYLDVLRQVADLSLVPVAVYNVSGEYSMLKIAGQNGCIDYKAAVLETLTAFKRAGASMIFTYHAKEAAAWL